MYTYTHIYIFIYICIYIYTYVNIHTTYAYIYKNESSHTCECVSTIIRMRRVTCMNDLQQSHISMTCKGMGKGVSSKGHSSGARALNTSTSSSKSLRAPSATQRTGHDSSTHATCIHTRERTHIHM